MMYVEGREKLGKNGGKVKKQRVTVKGSYAVCDIFPGLPFLATSSNLLFLYIPHRKVYPVAFSNNKLNKIVCRHFLYVLFIRTSTVGMQ